MHTTTLLLSLLLPVISALPGVQKRQNSGIDITYVSHLHYILADGITQHRMWTDTNCGDGGGGIVNSYGLYWQNAAWDTFLYEYIYPPSQPLFPLPPLRSPPAVAEPCQLKKSDKNTQFRSLQVDNHGQNNFAATIWLMEYQLGTTNCVQHTPKAVYAYAEQGCIPVSQITLFSCIEVHNSP
ncbi:hypothetical protein K440DRAFT_625177 [Wilcoxina mikolae CBS 423.85]|nr:hypothetical protein K440DRAFT_625177 [Wilcoxina mikolae CBS 423.85]